MIYINGDPRTTYSRVTSYKTFQVDDPENSDIATVAIKGNLSNKDELGRGLLLSGHERIFFCH